MRKSNLRWATGPGAVAAIWASGMGTLGVGVASERVDEVEQVLAVGIGEQGEEVARRLALPVVREDRVGQVEGAAVVQEPGLARDAPERLGAHLAAFGVSLIDAVAERSHVM